MVGLNGTCLVPGAVLISAVLAGCGLAGSKANPNGFDEGFISLIGMVFLPVKLEVPNKLEPDEVA